MKISVIIPTLNEAPTLATSLHTLSHDVEVIVVDGGSRDGTAKLAEAEGCRVCFSAPGRAR